MFQKSGIISFKYTDPQSHAQRSCTDYTDLLDYKKQDFFKSAEVGRKNIRS